MLIWQEHIYRSKTGITLTSGLRHPAFHTYITNETEKWSKVIRAASITPE